MATALLLAGCGDEQVAAPLDVKLVPVHVDPVTKSQRSRNIKAPGVAAPIRSVALATQVQGVISELNLRVGQTVKHGDVLARVTTVGLRGQDRAARARIKQFKTDIRKAKRDVRTYGELHRSGAVTRQAFEDAEFRLSSLRAQLEQARAAREQVRESYRGGTVKASFDGVVAHKSVELGAYVNPGQVVARVVDLRQVVITASVAEHDVLRVTPETEVRVTVPAATNRPFNGRVRAVAPTADTTTGAYTVEVLVDNSSGLIRGGMSAQVVFEQPGEEGLFVSVDSVRKRDGRHVVFVLQPDQRRVERRSVKVGEARDGLVRLLEGIEVGEHIVVSGVSRLRAGSLVRVVSGLATFDQSSSPTAGASLPSQEGTKAATL